MKSRGYLPSVAPMRYVSTRGQTDAVSFRDAVMMGLATDGGLLLPSSIPEISEKLNQWRSLRYQQLACEVMRPYVEPSTVDLSALVERSSSAFRHPEITPVVRVGEVFLAELFHGPTLAFKDVALQFLAHLFESFLKETGGEMNVVVATSGDTGSAAIHALRGREGIHIFVMHPHNRISKTQELQMTSVLDENVFNIAINGTFDDCQRILKVLLGDVRLKRDFCLGAVNSINWARVLSQIVYYFYSAFRVMDITGAARVRFAVPTGNFGDILAGYFAARMGLPISLLVLATNENDILRRFFATGEYSRGEVHATISPSMDIQVASNFERYLYYRVRERDDTLRGLMAQFAEEGRLKIDVPPGETVDPLFAAGTGDASATLATIRETYEKHDYLVEPHTAVGMHVAKQYLSPDEPMVCLATAHPAKFGEAIRRATGQDLAHHEVMDGLHDLPSRCEVLDSRVEDVRGFITQHGSVRRG